MISGGDCSQYIVKPLMELMERDNMEGLYAQALYETVYNSVALPCKDLKDVCSKLVNGFSVVTFPGVGALPLR